jgi:hypothetical protein
MLFVAIDTRSLWGSSASISRLFLAEVLALIAMFIISCVRRRQAGRKTGGCAPPRR